MYPSTKQLAHVKLPNAHRASEELFGNPSLFMKGKKKTRENCREALYVDMENLGSSTLKCSRTEAPFKAVNDIPLQGKMLICFIKKSWDFINFW